MCSVRCYIISVHSNNKFNLYIRDTIVCEFALWIWTWKMIIANIFSIRIFQWISSFLSIKRIHLISWIFYYDYFFLIEFQYNLLALQTEISDWKAHKLIWIDNPNYLSMLGVAVGISTWCCFSCEPRRSRVTAAWSCAAAAWSHCTPWGPRLQSAGRTVWRFWSGEPASANRWKSIWIVRDFDRRWFCSNFDGIKGVRWHLCEWNKM